MNTPIVQRLKTLLCNAMHAQSTSDAAATITQLEGSAALHDQGQIATALWQVAWASATGLRHLAEGGVCEDSCMARAPDASDALNLAVADGVSQGARGDLAALTAAQTVTAAPACSIDSSPEIYADALRQADAAVQAALKAITSERGATTLSCTWLGNDGHGYISRVGDCRAYAWQSVDGSVQAHSLLPDQTYTHFGETPRYGVSPSSPARMLGINGVGEPEVMPIQVPLGAGLVLCSDGLHEVMTEARWAEYMAPLTDLHVGETSRTTIQSLQTLAADLVRRAQEAGSEDDISVMVVWRGA